jgi:hypothetical protein
VALDGDCLADIAVLREQPWRLPIRDFLAHWGQTRRGKLFQAPWGISRHCFRTSDE